MACIAIFISFDCFEPSIIIIISFVYNNVWKNIESRVGLHKIGLNQFVYGAKFFEWKTRKQYRNAVVPGSIYCEVCRYRLSCSSRIYLRFKRNIYSTLLMSNHVFKFKQRVLLYLYMYPQFTFYTYCYSNH